MHFGLRNAAATYSDQIRVRLSDPATLGQIRSDPASGDELGFQHASFTLPPNRSSATEHRQIFIVLIRASVGVVGDDEDPAMLCRRRVVRWEGERGILEAEFCS